MSAHGEPIEVHASDGGALHAEYFAAAGDGPHPGVVVLHESFGLNDDIRRIASRFAAAGYASMAPSLYSHGRRIVCLSRVLVDMVRGSVAREIADIEAVRGALASREEVDGTRIAVAGFCQGGGFALIAGTRPGFRAAAVNYGEVPSERSVLDGLCPVVASYGARDRVFGAKRRPASRSTSTRSACRATSGSTTAPDTRSSPRWTAGRDGSRGCPRRWRSATKSAPPRTAGGGCSSSSPPTYDDRAIVGAPAAAIFGRSRTPMSTLSLHGDPARFPAGLQELGEGVWAWTQPNGGLGESNAGLIRGSGQSLLVDTLWDLRLTGAMLARMAEPTAQAPIRRVVNTHGDGDHCWGNQLLAGAELIGTEACARDVAAEDPRGVRVLGKAAGVVGLVAEHVPRSLPGVEQGVGLGAFASLLAPFDFEGVEATPPTHTFQGTLELDVGGRAVQVIEVGPAHTPGDAIVHVPDARVVFAADVMFVGVARSCGAGRSSAGRRPWSGSPSSTRSHVVPGHGPVSDLEGVRAMAAYWDFVTPAVRARLAAGRTPEEAAREVIASPEYAEQPFAAWDGPERLIVSADAIARNDGGEVGRPGDVARSGCSPRWAGSPSSAPPPLRLGSLRDVPTVAAHLTSIFRAP